MPIHRHEKREKYTKIDNNALCDKRLSWKARGLLSFLLTKKDNWVLILKDLLRQSPDGEDSTRKAINELTKYGYIIKKGQRRNTQNRFTFFDYDIFEFPLTEKPQAENHDVENRSAKKGPLVTTDRVTTEKVTTEEVTTKKAINSGVTKVTHNGSNYEFDPPSEDKKDIKASMVTNFDIRKVWEESIEPNSVKRVAAKIVNEKVIEEIVYSKEFEDFCEKFPRKQFKAKAFEVWKNINPDEMPHIFNALRNYLTDIKQAPYINIPYPAQWLNGQLEKLRKVAVNG